jgi:hypothetical protein
MTNGTILPAGAVFLALSLLVACSDGGGDEASRGESGSSAVAATPAEGVEPTEDDLAIAYGFLLDSPRPRDVVEDGLKTAELLRRRYGIDTGNPYQDRLAAARRAKREFLDRLDFSQSEIEATVASLGYSLDPDECLDYCQQVHRLAILELEKEALRAFAQGRKGPGRLLPSDPEAEPDIDSGE